MDNAIKKARISKRLSQRELANRINVSERSVGLWENGRIIPHFTHQRSLVEVLGIDFSAFDKKEEEHLMMISYTDTKRKRKRSPKMRRSALFCQQDGCDPVYLGIVTSRRDARRAASAHRRNGGGLAKSDWGTARIAGSFDGCYAPPSSSSLSGHFEWLEGYGGEYVLEEIGDPSADEICEINF